MNSSIVERRPGPLSSASASLRPAAARGVCIALCVKQPERKADVTDKDSTTNDLEAALQGLDYPATRAKLLSVAYLNRASPAVISRILGLPETADFVNEEELRRTLGVTVHGEHPHGWE